MTYGGNIRSIDNNPSRRNTHLRIDRHIVTIYETIDNDVKRL